MSIEDIQKFLDKKTNESKDSVRISFRKRPAIQGLFLRGHRDFAELKTKNFWRIVPESQVAAYRRTGDAGLAKIFSGTEFSRLVLVTG